MSHLKFIIIGVLISSISLNAEETPTWLKFSGFATLGATYSDNDKILYRADALSNEGSKGKFSIAPDSKIGLQFDTTFSDTLSASVQGVASQRTGTRNDARFEWASVKYTPNDAFSVQIGRLRAPFYMFSDILSVSYAYPWVRLPQEIYSPIPFTSFNGAQINYTYLQDFFEIGVNLYYGSNEEKLVTQPNAAPNTKFVLKNMKGIAVTGTVNDFKLRFSYMQDQATLQNQELDSLYSALSQNGFSEISEGLAINNKHFQFLSAGMHYDNTKYFVVGEYMLFRSKSLIGDFKSYYVSGGYHYDNWTPYVTFAGGSQANGYPETRIPASGPAAPLRQAVDGLLYSMNLAQQSSSVGVRYDFNKAVAVKVQYDVIRLDDTHLSIHLREENNLNDMHVLACSLDMVF